MLRNAPFVKRAWPSLLKRWAKLSWAGGYAVRRRQGGLFLLNYRNYVDRQLAFYGGFEAAQLARFKALSAGATLFIDIGANIGLYSVALAKALPNIKVIAFEPDQRNRAQLSANLLLNKLVDRVEIVSKAVTAQSGEIWFTEFSERSTGQSKVGDGPGARSVAAVALDDMLDLRNTRIAIKIDIEGHELEAIAGMARLARDNDCVFQIESFGNKAARLNEIMATLGYAQTGSIDSDRYFQKSA
jgi:FkbM family methyltransferase